IRAVGARVSVHGLFRGPPIRFQPYVMLLRHLTGSTRLRAIGFAAHFPPALAAMVVLMVNGKPGPSEHRPDPADAVVAIIGMLLQAVAQEKPFGRTIVN